LKATDRAATLTRQLLGFSHRSPLQPCDFSVRDTIKDLVKLIRPVIGEHIDLETMVTDDAGMLHADPAQLQQVLLNLCINARDAMPSGGTITVRAEQATITDPPWDREFQTEPGPYVVLSVTDTGCGMSSAVRSRIFEPFFTTKEVGKGTGLGLAMVYGVIQQHHGAIQVDSDPGQGTTFRLYLPSGSVEPTRDGIPAETPLPHGAETILIVEDEQLVRTLGARMLRSADYTVFEACNGEEALYALEHNADDISLVILDMVMPGLSGHEVYERLKLMRPSIKVLFCTGYDPETAHTGGIISAGHHLLQKPYDAPKLLRAVRAVLDDKRADSRVPELSV